jgi:hypothetical protein
VFYKTAAVYSVSLGSAGSTNFVSVHIREIQIFPLENSYVPRQNHLLWEGIQFGAEVLH